MVMFRDAKGVPTDLGVFKTKRDADETRDEEDRKEIDFFLILYILPFSASSASLSIWTPRIIGTPDANIA